MFGAAEDPVSGGRGSCARLARTDPSRGIRGRAHMIDTHESNNSSQDSGESWTLYLLRCRDGSLYTGITTDLQRRLIQHQDGSASRYTRSRRPVRIAYREPCAGRSHALKRERAVKALSRSAKERLIG